MDWNRVNEVMSDGVEFGRWRLLLLDARSDSMRTGMLAKADGSWTCVQRQSPTTGIIQDLYPNSALGLRVWDLSTSPRRVSGPLRFVDSRKNGFFWQKTVHGFIGLGVDQTPVRSFPEGSHIRSISPQTHIYKSLVIKNIIDI